MQNTGVRAAEGRAHLTRLRAVPLDPAKQRHKGRRWPDEINASFANIGVATARRRAVAS
jgi:hypothetical protein